MKTCTLEEFGVMLKKHDWSYDYADNREEYRKGAAQAAEIRRVRESFTGEDREKADALYRQYNPLTRERVGTA